MESLRSSAQDDQFKDALMVGVFHIGKVVRK